MTDYKKGLIGHTVSDGRKVSLPLADFERDLVIYFFAKLKLADPRFYNQSMPDERTEKLTKREFSNSIRYLDNEKIDKGFSLLHKAMAANEPEYRFLTIPKVVGLCDGSATISSSEGVQAGAHKVFETLALPEPLEYKSSRYQEGIKQTSALLAMFEDDSKAEEVHDEKLDRIKRGEL